MTYYFIDTHQSGHKSIWHSHMYEYALVHDHQVKIFILPKSLIGQYFYLIKVALKAWLNKSYVILLDGDNFSHSHSFLTLNSYAFIVILIFYRIRKLNQ